MRLRRSDVNGPGLSRIRRGKGFSYRFPDGTAVRDPAVLDRVNGLAVPPAWRRVWICPFPNGHIQATGTDAAGRRQYLYHPRWHEERSEEKFDRVLQMSPALPPWRARIAAELSDSGLHRDRVLALGLHLLDRGYFRAGNDSYAQDNNSYGIATLLREHVTVRGDTVAFDYPAKSGVQRTWQITDARMAGAVGELLRVGPDDGRLLTWHKDSGGDSEWVDVHAEDLNARFKEMVGAEYSVKDLRTWHGTVLAAVAFVGADPPVNKTVRKRVEAAVMREVSDELGNTPAVARGSYVDPRVVRGYESGLTIATAVRRAARISDRDGAQSILDKATATMIRKVGSRRRQ